MGEGGQGDEGIKNKYREIIDRENLQFNII